MNKDLPPNPFRTPQLHNIFSDFIMNGRKCMTHKKRGRFYLEARKITEMREKLLTFTFTFCGTFKRGINRPNIDPQLFFFLKFIYHCSKL